MTEFCGPNHLSDIVTHFRALHSQGRDPNDQPVLSEQGQRRLLSLCTSASLLKEEGQGVQFQLHVGGSPPTREASEWTLRFDAPVELHDSDILRKLAPACPRSDFALVVDEVNHVLRVIGILKLRRHAELTPYGSPLRIAMGNIRGMTVAVLGAGNIAVYGGHPPIELRAGRLHSMAVRLTECSRVDQIFARITNLIFGDRDGNKPPFATDWPPGGPTLLPYMVGDMWQSVIAGLIKSSRGGALVITPNSSHEDIEIKQRVCDLNIGNKLAELWDKSFKFPLELESEKLVHWRTSWTQLQFAVDCVINFAAVDGCVVLDHRLTVHGFGAKLKTAKTPHSSANAIRYVNADTGRDDPSLPDRVRRFGTRHSSAFTFCETHPDTIVFVVSQDADVRIFLRDRDEVMMIEANNFPADSTIATAPASLSWLVE